MAVEDGVVYDVLLDGLKQILNDSGGPFPRDRQIDITFDSVGDESPLNQLSQMLQTRDGTKHYPKCLIVYEGATIDPNFAAGEQVEDAQINIWFGVSSSSNRRALTGNGSPNWGVLGIQKWVMNLLNMDTHGTYVIRTPADRAWIVRGITNIRLIPNLLAFTAMNRITVICRLIHDTV